MAADRASRIALLIDCENIPSKYYNGILTELLKQGPVLMKRAYGDFFANGMAGWVNVCRQNDIEIRSQTTMTGNGKNAADITLAIDAMECLYTRTAIDLYAIASSDSDFAPLAKRLREMAKHVVGFGKKNTPHAFLAACDNFVTLESLPISTDRSLGDNAEIGIDRAGIVKIDEARRLVHQACVTLQRGAENGRVRDSHLHDFVRRQYPWFNIGIYDYWKWSSFLKDTPGLDTEKTNNDKFVWAIPIAGEGKQESTIPIEVCRLIRRLCKKAAATASDPELGVYVANLEKLVRQKDSSFQYKAYGFSKWTVFLSKIPRVQVHMVGHSAYAKVTPKLRGNVTLSDQNRDRQSKVVKSVLQKRRVDDKPLAKKRKIADSALC